MAKKTAFSPREKLIAAHLHLIGGADQHIIAGAFGVNPGRIAETLADVKQAVGWPAKGEDITD